MNAPGSALGARRGVPLDRRGLASARPGWGEFAFWIALPLLAFIFPQYLVLGSQILITGIAALSLDLILGYAGIVSLGQAAFFGIGAYSAGLLAAHGHTEPVSGLVGAALVAGASGFLLSFLVVRGGDLTRLMVTLGIGLMLYEAANQLASITGGVDGLQGVATAPLFGVFEWDIEGRVAYWYCLGVAFLVFLVARRVVRSPFGLSLMGLRENPRRMAALGASVRGRQVAVFTGAAAIAGIAGALLTETTQFVGLNTLSFGRSADLLILLVLGGTGRLYGAFVGAAVFMIAQDLLSEMNPVYWQFWVGVLLIAVVLVGRGGLLGLADRGAAWVRRRTRGVS